MFEENLNLRKVCEGKENLNLRKECEGKKERPRVGEREREWET